MNIYIYLYVFWRVSLKAIFILFVTIKTVKTLLFYFHTQPGDNFHKSLCEQCLCTETKNSKMELNSYKCNEKQCLKNCDKVLFDENFCIFIHSECEPLKLYVNKVFKWPHILHPGSFTHILYFLKSKMSVFLKQVKIYVIYVVYYYWYVWRPDLNIGKCCPKCCCWFVKSIFKRVFICSLYS